MQKLRIKIISLSYQPLGLADVSVRAIAVHRLLTQPIMSGTTGHRLLPRNMDTTGSFQRQMVGESSTSYQIWSHHSWLKKRGH
jgi:hypothetical protein